MVKMVVFDLDGTLVNSLVDLGIATNEGLKQAGLPVHPMENYNHFVGNGREMLVKRAMGEKSEDKALFDTVMNGFNTYYGAHSNDHTAVIMPFLSSCSKSSVQPLYSAVWSLL